MEVIENTALRLTVPNQIAQNILSKVEKSELIIDCGTAKDIAVYWGFDEASLLTYLLDGELPKEGTPIIPSPILRDYNWPGVFKPFDHQKSTASFLSLRQRAFCFNEAGTGKTSAAIWAADYLMTLGLVKRVLVICPLSIMHSAWQADIFKTAMHRSCGVAYGDGAKRKQIINNPYDFIVINYDGVAIVRDEIRNGGFDLIIVDEANAYKTPTTKRWKTLASIITSDTRLWMMTGTPASQSPVDAYGLAKLISPYRVPKFMSAWRDKVMRQVSRFKWMPKPDSQHEVRYALQPAIRYTKKECLDLPEVTYQTREVPLTVQVARYYKTLKNQMLIEAAGQMVSAVNAAASMSKLLQISGGAVYTDHRDVVEFDVSPRLEAMREVLDETSNKVVIFVPYIHTIDVVTEYLNREGYTNEVIKGDVPPKTRADIIDRFQSQENPRVLVIQPQAASHGVTLTAADTIIFWSPVMSVETYLQCIGRIDRVGQRNPCTVVHLQGSDAERRVYNMLQGKVDSHQKLVDLYKQELESV
jgi:SNF2 family DNA or RNA helicase